MSSIQDLKPDEGAVIQVGNQKIAAYKTADDKLLTFSPVCTHTGCIVGWNGTDKTWDCPCHGSRYEKTGTVKQGPAQRDLETIAVNID